MWTPPRSGRTSTPPAPEQKGGGLQPRCGGPAVDGEALGRSRGGLTSKVHLAVDGRGLPMSVVLTPGQAGDNPQLLSLLDAIARCHPGAPRRPGGGRAHGPTPPPVHPVVAEALRSCTHPIDPALSMRGTYERRDAVRAVKTLRGAGLPMPPGAVRAWALAHGWSGPGGKDLRDAVDKANNGVDSQARGHDTTPHTPALAQWRERAARAAADPAG